MGEFEQEATGRLLNPRDGDLVVNALKAAKSSLIDPTLLAELRTLDAVTPASDSDAGAIRIALAQLATRHFELTREPNDSEPALDAARSLAEFDTLPIWLTSYERGRTAYQVGKYLRDPALMEEAVHFYNESLTAHNRPSTRRRTLRRYRAEAAVLRAAFAEEETQRTGLQGLVAAHFDIALDAFPAAKGARRKRGLRGRLTGWREPIFCRPLGLSAQAKFWWSGKVTPLSKRIGQLNDRGRRTTGLMNGMESDSSTLVNQMSLTIWTGTNDPGEAERVVRQQAVELYEWAERVSAWTDVITNRIPKFGHLIVTRYLYGDLFQPDGVTKRLILNADEPGVTWELRLGGGRDVGRYELSLVLNRLTLHEVPIAIEMLQKAQYSQLDDQPRQAIIEAGTAAEAALSVLYDSYPTTAPREAPKQRSWTLGTLVNKAHKAGILPAGDTQDSLQHELVRPRNEAVHRGHATRAQAINVIDAARRIVDHTFSTGTRDAVVIDRRMRQLSPLLNPRPTVRAGFSLPDDGTAPRKT